jgi:hypothetical protein
MITCNICSTAHKQQYAGQILLGIRDLEERATSYLAASAPLVGILHLQALRFVLDGAARDRE